MAADKTFGQCPLIVENIFKNLCAKDLSSCAQVCKMWKSMSETENKRRQSLEWFLQHGDEDDYLGMFGRLSSGKYSFQECMLGAMIKPVTCFSLMTTHLVDQNVFSGDFRQGMPPFKKTKKGKYEKKQHQLMAIADHYLKPSLPKACQLFCVSSAGIIGSHGNQTPIEVEVGAAIAGILIPHFNGMEIHQMVIEKNVVPKLPKLPIKCLLMFMGPYPEHIVPFVERCVASQGEKFALGGALIDASTTGLGTCLAFTGEYVEAASIVIDRSVEDIAEELQCFEKTGLLQNQCFCFAFACVEKGSRLYKTSNYESNLFRKIYPNVPLLGVFGYGEIGVYHVPNVEREVHEERVAKFNYESCFWSHSTTFVLVSVKKAT